MNAQSHLMNREFDRAVADSEAKEPARFAWWLGAGVALCLFVIVAGLAYAAATGRLLGAWTFWAAIGSGIIAAFGVLGFAALRNETRSRATLTEPTYLEAFRYGPDPTLITRGGVPALANDAYLQLAERVGVLGETGTPPTLDRLFAASTSQEVSGSLYRLLRHGVGREQINIIDEEGRLRTYEVDATRLSEATSGATLWRVRDLTGPEPEATHLAEAPVGLATVLANGRIIAANATLRRWLGLGAGQKPGTLADVVEDAEAILATPQEIGRTSRFDTQLRTAKGVKTPTVAVVGWGALEDDTPIASIALYGHSNIAAKAPAADATMRRVTEGLQAGDTFMSAPFAILELDGRDLSVAKVNTANPAFSVMTGLSGEGMAFAELLEDPDPRLFRQDGAAANALDARVRTADGNLLHTQVSIVCHPRKDDLCWAYIVDVSKRQQLQEQLVQSQKMQAIGQLAAGVAHDFNNLLLAIRLNTDELLGRHPVGDPSYLELQGINSNVMRAAALVKKLLAFSRKQTRRAERLDVGDTLAELHHTLRQTLSERVKLDIQHGRELPPIRVDKSQLETVLINLCVNARDAMVDPDTGSGTGEITIRSSKVEAGDRPLTAPHEGQAVLIEVADTGSGMDAELLARIFEPFFTTKDENKGTGLGLATVYGIVEQSGGHLEVDSVVGEGTTFRIYLPAADPDAVIEEPPKVEGPKTPANLSGQGTILFVEDEESVRTIAAKTLRKRGYNVVEAGDGEEAYEWLEAGEPVDLLISDVVMPGMDGPTLLRKGRGMLGDARIVFISGYAQEEFSDLLAEEPDVTFLPKPFSLAQLAEKVKAEIGEAVA